MDAADKIRSLVTDEGEISNRDLVKHLKVSAATSHRLLQGLVMAGVLERRGKGRSTRYCLRRIRKRLRLAGLEEDSVWREVSERVARIRPLEAEEESSLRYAATEVINNAIDQSVGMFMKVEVDF
jgi:DNA-binding IclR family transcriptional regulator